MGDRDLKHPVFELARRLGAELKQTHASWVLLLPDRVYKIKKPVNFGFLDYSTPEKRRQMCQKELLLNRRLCPWLYESVVPVSEINGRWELENPSNPVEWAVKMKRIPEGALLSERLDRATKEELKKVALRLAEFHKKAERADRYGSLEVIRYNAQENFDQTAPFVGDAITEDDYAFIKEKTFAFLDKKTRLFQRRVEEGKIKDGHGDVRAEHVAFLPQGVCIFDCIEFNDRFRCGDVVNDMCFLSTELEFFGRPELAKAYEDEYFALTGDEEGRELLPFYKTYRAYVRGKVYSFLSRDENLKPEERERAKETARKFFKLARKYAEEL
ncbi:MAG: gluconokinase [Aquificae bacterium]|nr:gluconokinase [Aquificota bacterium]